LEDGDINTGDFFGVDQLDTLQEGLDGDILINDNAHENSQNKNLLGKRQAPDSQVKKSKKEIFKEIIKKSKMEKYKRMEEREEQKRMVEEMKDEYRGIVTKLSFLDKTELKKAVLAEQSEGSDDDDYNSFLTKVRHQGLMRPEREVKKKEEDDEEDPNEEPKEVEDEEELEDSYIEEQSDQGDEIGNYQKIEKIKYDKKIDQMEDFEVKEQNKQDKKFSDLGSKREEKFLELLDELEDEESDDSDEGTGYGLIFR
jgi:nucleolar protein 14